ncbi:MAG: NAD(P)-dependent malic enzyme [Candidatus Micrarchaeaceae archaeon]
MISKGDVLKKHRKNRGKIEVVGRVEVETKEQLSTYYTPGVAYACLAIKDHKDSVYDYTMKGRTVAIVTDGTRILGLGNIGPEAGLPVMEGKSLLLKKFGGVDAVPLCINSTDENEIVSIIKSVQPSFGAINIEDIETPKCFRIVDRLKKTLDIPVFHDDRSGVGVVTLAALLNALKLAGKSLKSSSIVINGSGAAGTGIAELLHYAGARNICVADTAGLLYKGRKKDMNYMKERLASMTNKNMLKGDLDDAADGADVLIGVSTKNKFGKNLIKSMSDRPIVFALANPDPEIEYDDARRAGAFIVATGRSDTPNQVNNLLAFPGIIRGLLEARARAIDEHMLLMAARKIAESIGDDLSVEHIVPDPTDGMVVNKLAADVAAVIAETAAMRGLARVKVNGSKVRGNVAKSLKRYRNIERFISKAVG